MINLSLVTLKGLFQANASMNNLTVFSWDLSGTYEIYESSSYLDEKSLEKNHLWKQPFNSFFVPLELWR